MAVTFFVVFSVYLLLFPLIHGSVLVNERKPSLLGLFILLLSYYPFPCLAY